MSKSLGNVLDPVYLTETYGADAIRYFLFEANTFDQDGDFSRQDMIKKVNSHLAKGLGNLLNRAVSLLERNFNGKVPELAPDAEMLAKVEEASSRYHQYMSELEFAKAIKIVFEGIVDEANRYISDKKPWDMFKSGAKDEGGIVLSTVMSMLKRAALLLAPVTPKLSRDIWEQLGFDVPLDSVHCNDELYKSPVPAGQAVRNLGPVFKQIEEPAVEASAVGKTN